MASSLQLQPIPYQGSKRQIAAQILDFFPAQKIQRLVEPFAGSGAISLAAAANSRSSSFLLNDVYGPLIELWKLIVNDPEHLSKLYTVLWNEQLDDPKAFYNAVRARFNQDSKPEEFLYLMARAVKNAIRFNSMGEFNQSPDNRRLGRKPGLMRKQIIQTSFLLKGKVELKSIDYEKILSSLHSDDFVYMDPPYQGTSTKKNPRYCQGIDLDRFIQNLEMLNNRDIPYIVSFDGHLGDKSYGEDLPQNLDLTKVDITAGRSAQSTLNGKQEITVESLYLSAKAKELAANSKSQSHEPRYA